MTPLVLHAAVLITVLAAPASSGASAVTRSPKNEVNSPVDRLVSVGHGQRMHIRCMGFGSPAVVLFAGMGADADTWKPVQQKLSKMTRVCSFDRPGYGTSDIGTEPLSARYVTSEVALLLAAARVEPPFIPVGHSYGGLEAVLFTSRFRTSAAGLVLVDPSYPHQDRFFAKASVSGGRAYQAMVDGKNKVVRDCIATIEARRDGCWGPPWGDRFLGYLKSKLSLYESLEASSDEVANISSLGDIPMIVLTAGVAARLPGDTQPDVPVASSAWYLMHDRYARLSTRGLHRIVAAAAHMIQDDQPDLLVATVGELIAKARASTNTLQPDHR
jgi:pimeloyl-ACP methyl ester carboxylesterase